MSLSPADTDDHDNWLLQLSPDQGKTVSGEDLVDGLEVSRATGTAVTAASGGDTLGLSAGVEGTARVARLGADIGTSHAGDGSLGVVDGHTSLADSAAEDTGGRAGAADAGTDGSHAAARDRQAAPAVAVDVRPEGVSAGGADVSHVSAAGEDGAREGSKSLATAGRGRGTNAATVTGGNKASGDGETDGASATTHVVSVATLNRGKGSWHLLDRADLELGLGQANLGGHVLSLGSASGQSLNDDLVGGHIDEPRSDANIGRALGAEGLDRANLQLVESNLGLLEFGEAVGDNSRRSTGSDNLLSRGLVSDANIDGAAVIFDPGAGERVTQGGAELLNDLGGGDLAGDPSSSLVGVQSQVALHGGQDLGVKAGGGAGGSTVGKGQDGGQEAEKLCELHNAGKIVRKRVDCEVWE